MMARTRHPHLIIAEYIFFAFPRRFTVLRRFTYTHTDAALLIISSSAKLYFGAMHFYSRCFILRTRHLATGDICAMRFGTSLYHTPVRD